MQTLKTTNIKIIKTATTLFKNHRCFYMKSGYLRSSQKELESFLLVISCLVK